MFSVIPEMKLKTQSIFCLHLIIFKACTSEGRGLVVEGVGDESNPLHCLHKASPTPLRARRGLGLITKPPPLLAQGSSHPPPR